MTAGTLDVRTTEIRTVFPLDQAIGFALLQLEKLQLVGIEQITPGEASSLLNDICLDAEVSGRELPVPLCKLRLSAIARNSADTKPGNAPNFILTGLHWTLSAALRLL